MHNHFDVFFQQAASLHITEREDVPCDTRLGLAKPAGDAPVISPEGVGEWGMSLLELIIMTSLCCYKYINILTPGSSGDCSLKLSHLLLPVPSHFQILSQTRQPWLFVLSIYVF